MQCDQRITLLRAGEPAKAGDHLRKVLALSEKAFGRDHAQTLTVRRLLAEADGRATKDPHQLDLLAELLAKQPDTRTREAVSIRKSRVAVLAAQGQVQDAVNDACRLLSEIDTPSGECSREGAVMRLDLARGLRVAAPDVAREFASQAAMVFSKEIGQDSAAATHARRIELGTR